jgi:nucleotide-binding universal stress UspA family protein
MKNQILVPLDGSELAEGVLPDAVSMAHITGSSLVLLSAISTFSVADTMSAIFPVAPTAWDDWEDEVKQAHSYLASVAQRLARARLQVQTEVVDGQAAPSIVKYAEEHSSVRMIAMATHGRSGLGRLILGSVADEVLRLSPVPLLLVRTNTHHGPITLPHNDAVRASYKTILVPLDSSALAEQALDHASSLASTPESSLLLVTILPTSRSTMPISDEYAPLWLEEVQRSETTRLKTYLFGIAQKLRNKGLRVRLETPTGTPAAELLRAAQAARADLIVMTTHGRSGLQRLWLGSVATSIVHQSTCPVLLIRASERDAHEQLAADLSAEQPSLEQGLPR